MTLPYVVLAALLAAAFYKDVKHSIIPNALTGSGTAFAFVYYLAVDGWNGLLFSLGGFAAGFGLMLALYMCGAVGAGDVKLFGAIGALAGPRFVVVGAVHSVVFAGAIGLVLMLAKRQLLIRLRRALYALTGFVWLKDAGALVRLKQTDGMTFPFMYAVLPGIAATWIYGGY